MEYINTLREGTNVSETYFVKSKTVAQTKAGKTYYNLVLQDKTGTIDGKIWELSNAIEHFEALDYIKVEGMVVSFNNNLQLNIRRVRRAGEGEYDIAEYMPVSKNSTGDMYDELISIINSVEETHLNALLKAFFVDDKAFAEGFKRHSAAKSIHHSFIGGLLQHSLAVTRICIFLAKQYPVLNRDLLITSALCHDIGKMYELSDFPHNDYTDEGQLLGHIVMGAMMVRDKANSIEGFPVKLQNELVHCILAHHGELEFGSPKKPEIIEAVALSYADNIDAKIETFTEILENSSSKEEWLGFNKLFDANIRRT